MQSKLALFISSKNKNVIQLYLSIEFLTNKINHLNTKLQLKTKKNKQKNLNNMTILLINYFVFAQF